MFCKAVLCLTTLHFYSVAAQGECTDLRGRAISHGLHYVPGPDTCTLCVCDNGLPKVCKAVLCSPPQDCRSFRVGNTCCEFICLDDVVKPAEGAEANVRVAAGGAAGVVLLTVALLVYRVRRQKRRRTPHADDQRSLTSIGYISGSMGYMGGTCETALAAWKPPSNYLPRGEAPPPYDEVVAQCRPEAMRISNEGAFHRTYPVTMETLVRPDDTMQCIGHGYINIPRPMQQMANTQNCYNAPLLQPVQQPEARDVNPMPHHPIASNVVVGYPSAIRLTGSLGAISGRALAVLPAPDPERPRNVPGFYTNTANMHTSLHRTIPRMPAAAEAPALDAMSGFSRGERSLHGEIRRSFHKPGDARHCGGARDTGRSVPRNLDLASTAAGHDASKLRLGGGQSRAHSEEQNVGAEGRPPDASVAATAAAAAAVTTVATAATAATAATTATTATAAPAPSTLPLTVDKPSCVCSYEGAAAPGAEDADDYRSECENCKSASSSRWILEEGWAAEESDGTQTLQRRAPPIAPPAPATATLPQPVTKQSRTVMGPPSNWENWFNTIPDSDTESEED